MTRRTALALALPAILSSGEGFAVVTKKTNANPVTKAQLKRLILGQGATWPGGGKMSLMLGPPNEPSRVAALKQIADMSEADFNKNVMHLGFTGHADAAPATMPSTAMVRQLVTVNPGAVGIIPPGEVTDALNKIEVE